MLTQLEILELALKQQRLNLNYACKLFDKKETPEHKQRFINESKKFDYIKFLINKEKNNNK